MSTLKGTSHQVYYWTIYALRPTDHRLWEPKWPSKFERMKRLRGVNPTWHGTKDVSWYVRPTSNRLVENKLGNRNTPKFKNHICFYHDVMGGMTHINTLITKYRMDESQHHMSLDYTWRYVTTVTLFISITIFGGTNIIMHNTPCIQIGCEEYSA